MSLNRFEQLKRYFHVSDPRIELEVKDWYKKLDPLASVLEERFRAYYLPAIKVAIDEMVVRFCGRSQHILKIRNKPIKEGYKIFALCDHGYTYSFLWYSSTQGIAELPPASTALSPTSSGGLQLAQLLPPNHQWHLILDNYFTNVPLFEKLRKLGIGAAGTTHANATGFPASLKIEKEEAKKVLPWGHVSGEMVGNICCLVWQDNSSVFFMTSYHDIALKVERLRRCPKKTITNAAVVHGIFGDKARKKLPIPQFIDDYNYHMGGVDIADQLQSYYNTQLRSCRNWYPLFYWLLDTTLVNCYRIQKTINPRQIVRSQHYFFRLEIAEQLIQNGLHISSPLSSLSTRFPKPIITSSSVGSRTPTLLSHPLSSLISHNIFTSQPVPISLSSLPSSPPFTHSASFSAPSLVFTNPQDYLPQGPPSTLALPAVVEPSPPSDSYDRTKYIHRPNGRYSSVSKRSKPLLKSFPLPNTHTIKQRPTNTLCIFCRWKRLEHRAQAAKVRSVSYGCKECNLALCYECFPVFHSLS